jgi:hypothetical protein
MTPLFSDAKLGEENIQFSHYEMRAIQIKAEKTFFNHTIRKTFQFLMKSPIMFYTLPPSLDQCVFLKRSILLAALRALFCLIIGFKVKSTAPVTQNCYHICMINYIL